MADIGLSRLVAKRLRDEPVRMFKPVEECPRKNGHIIRVLTPEYVAKLKLRKEG
jgi:hypothetical protein